MYMWSWSYKKTHQKPNNSHKTNATIQSGQRPFKHGLYLLQTETFYQSNP